MVSAECEFTLFPALESLKPKKGQELPVADPDLNWGVTNVLTAAVNKFLINQPMIK